MQIELRLATYTSADHGTFIIDMSGVSFLSSIANDSVRGFGSLPAPRLGSPALK